MPITVEALVRAPIDTVWEAWTAPAHITKWNAASDDWHTPHAEADLRAGGAFLSRMEAKDGSVGFDFTGTYTRVEPPHRLAYEIADGRAVSVTFAEEDDGVRIVETFDAETVHSEEMQRAGWQAILDRFVAYTEGL